MSKLTLLAAAGAGYVLGTKAGRGRYEQLRRGAQRVAADPRVQAAGAKAQDAVKSGVSSAASSATDRIRH